MCRRIKNIEIMEQENLFAHSAALGATLLTTLQEQLKEHPHVGDIRGKGLLIGIELVQDKTAKHHSISRL